MRKILPILLALFSITLLPWASAETKVTLQVVNGGETLTVTPQLAIIPNITTPAQSGSAVLTVGSNAGINVVAPPFNTQPEWGQGAEVNVAANATNTEISFMLTLGTSGTTAVLYLEGFYGSDTPYAFPLTLGQNPGGNLANYTAPQTVSAPFLDNVSVNSSGSDSYTVTLTVNSSYAAPTNTQFKVDGTEVKKNGAEFLAKGLDYSPTPIGGATFSPGIGDWFTPPWWTGSSSGIGGRDIPNFTDMGVNALRTYFTWFWVKNPDITVLTNLSQTSAPLIYYPTATPTPGKYPYVVAFNHRPFLDACAEAGIGVVLGIAFEGGNAFNFPQPTVASAYQNFYQQTAVKLATLYGNHPAVIGFCFGNEQNGTAKTGGNTGPNDDSRIWLYYDQVYQAVKAAAPSKLFTIAFQDDQALYDGSLTVIDPPSFTSPSKFNNQPIEKVISSVLDVWGLNIYAGISTDFPTFRQNVIEPDNGAYEAPLWVTEWGTPSGKNVKGPDGSLQGPPDGDATARKLTPQEFTQNASIISNAITHMQDHVDFVMGAFYFAYSDEWWKNESTPVTEQNASASPDWPEEYWGLYSVAVNGRSAINPDPTKPDTLTATPFVSDVTTGYANLQETFDNHATVANQFGLDNASSASLLERQSPVRQTPWGGLTPIPGSDNFYYLDLLGPVRLIEYVGQEGLLVRDEGRLIFLSQREPDYAYVQGEGWQLIVEDEGIESTFPVLDLTPPDRTQLSDEQGPEPQGPSVSSPE